jgi:replicative DNA helicase
MVNSTPTSMGAERYARIVKDYSARRRLLEAANNAARAAYNLEVRIEDSLPNVVDKVLDSARIDGGAHHVSHFTKNVREQIIERMNNPRQLDGIPTGFIEFDRVSMGLQPGEVLMITAEPGVGKSITAMQAALQMAQKGYPVACYALEMRGEAVVRRWLAGLSKVRVSAMRQGINNVDLAPIIHALESIDSLPIYICDKPSMTIGAIRSDLTRLQKRHDVKAFVLDYDYLLSDGQGMTENDRTILISAGIKHVCRDRGIPGIIIHSQNKGNASQGAMNMLRGSKQVAFDIDWLISMKQDGLTNRAIICTIDKGREMEMARQAFTLIKLDGLPWVGNAEQRQVNLNNLPYNNERRFP